MRLSNHWTRLALIAPLAVATFGCRFFKTGDSCPSGPGLESRGIRGAALADGQLSLTFDGGPGDSTQELVDFLFANQVQATFFVAGRGAEAYPSVLDAMKQRGHLVANYGYSAEPFKDSKDPVLEVRKTDELIAPYVTGNMFILRTPEGELQQEDADRLNAAGLTRYVGPVRWDIGGEGVSDRECWAQGIGTDDCSDRYMKKIRLDRRGIVRFAGESAQTLALIKSIVPKLQAEQFTLVRLDAVPEVRQGLEQSGGKPGTVGGAAGCAEY